MKDRIKKIMDSENLSPAKFADKLQINRAVISHILNGRNNPSLDVVTKILSDMDYLNSDWLINGKGSMYKDGYSAPTDQNNWSLFNSSDINAVDSAPHSEYAKENELTAPASVDKPAGVQHLSQVSGSARKVKQIIIYYTDNTFETFTPH